MSVEASVRGRIYNLMQEGLPLAKGTEHGVARNIQQTAQCGAWITAAANAVRLACPSPQNAYHQAAARLEASPRSGSIVRPVGEFVEMLRHLLHDIDNGLLTSVANQARAETLDDLL